MTQKENLFRWTKYSSDNSSIRKECICKLVAEKSNSSKYTCYEISNDNGKTFGPILKLASNYTISSSNQ